MLVIAQFITEMHRSNVVLCECVTHYISVLYYVFPGEKMLRTPRFRSMIESDAISARGWHERAQELVMQMRQSHLGKV